MNRDIPVPKEISPCPIIEALLEIRFTPNVPTEAIVGIVYPILREKFSGKLESLPVTQLPNEIRSTDQFRFAPWYKLQNENLIVQIGPRVISFSNVSKYIGWESLFPIINEYFQKIFATNIFTSFDRIGLRYINFFQQNIFENSTLSLQINGKPFQTIDQTIRSTIQFGKFKSIVNIVNNASVMVSNKMSFGSILDIDTFLEAKIESEKIMALVDEAHTEEKLIFFNLLKAEFVSTLKPTFKK